MARTGYRRKYAPRRCIRRKYHGNRLQKTAGWTLQILLEGRRPDRLRRGQQNMTSKHENTNSPAIGVDIGTSRIVAAQRKGEGFQYSTQLNAYVAVPFSKLTVSVLEKEKIPHAIEDGWIRVHGNESEAFADLM